MDQEKKIILLDHEKVVDGVVLRERKELKNISDEDGNNERSILIRIRYIGDRIYQEVGEGEFVDNEIILFFSKRSIFPDENIERFKEEWQEKWKLEQSLGIQERLCDLSENISVNKFRQAKQNNRKI